MDMIEIFSQGRVDKTAARYQRNRQVGHRLLFSGQSTRSRRTRHQRRWHLRFAEFSTKRARSSPRRPTPTAIAGRCLGKFSETARQVEQLEDQKYQGKITARYVFKGDQVINQEQVANGEPPRASAPFARSKRNVAKYGGHGDGRRAAGDGGHFRGWSPVRNKVRFRPLDRMRMKRRLGPIRLAYC